MRLLSILLSVLLLQWSFVALAETDYSYLDDMTINELKQLDAEIHKRLPSNNTGSDINVESGAGNVFGLLAWNTTPEVEPKDLNVGEKITTDFTEFEVLEISVLRRADNARSEQFYVSERGIKAPCNVDADCSVLKVFYQVKNTGTKSKWYWPSNLKAKVYWNEYEFESIPAGQYGDLQCTQSGTYVAFVPIPNSILKKGCDDIIVDIGFKEYFYPNEGVEKCPYRYTLHTSYK